MRDKTAILVPIYNEDKHLVKINLMAIYSNVSDSSVMYVLDDSTNGSSDYLKDMCKKLGITYIHREDRTGYKAGALNNVLRTLVDVAYVAVIDIDQMPSPDFIRETTEILYKHPKAAFVQVPQVYWNTDANPLAEMAQAQQFIFYDILTEGKSIDGTLFSCGTNVVYRLEALKSVGYFDESNIVEDIATSVKMFSKGWDGIYYNKKLVFGRAPTTMKGYLNQQTRWMMGSLALAPGIFKLILTSKSFNFSQKLDWFASSSWYFFGFAYLVFLLAPFLDIIGIKVITINTTLYILAWMPYTVLNLTAFIYSQLNKKAPWHYVFYNMAANAVIFPTSIISAISVLFKKKKPFITARTGDKLPLYHFWPQLIIIVILSISVGFLLYRHTIFDDVTAFWALFQIMLLSPIFILNKTPKITDIDEPAFKIFN
ncbi:MAG: glycosyltransferase family 2 protein [Ferroplasma sp.]